MTSDPILPRMLPRNQAVSITWISAGEELHSAMRTTATMMTRYRCLPPHAQNLWVQASMKIILTKRTSYSQR